MPDLLHHAHRPLQEVLHAQAALLLALHLVLLVRGAEMVMSVRGAACIIPAAAPTAGSPAARPADGEAREYGNRAPPCPAPRSDRLRGAAGRGGDAPGETHNPGHHVTTTITTSVVTTISSPRPPSR